MIFMKEKLYVPDASPDEGKDIDWSKARRVTFPNLGSAGVPPAELGVAPSSLSHGLRQSKKASGETRALPKKFRTP
jgi:hypothetical protein